MPGISTLALAEIDTLLLRAALLDGAAARAAYDALRARFDLDALDYGRQRLLPLLHRNLTGFGVDDPLLGRLRGVRHYHWAKNQVRMKALAPVLAHLEAAGIPTVLLKGTALLATCLDDMSLRPMDDIDLLVPYPRRAAAAAILAQSGYQPFNAPLWCIAEWMRDLPGHVFVNPDKHQIDLHWHVLHLDMRPTADEAFWSRIQPVEFAGARTAILDPADQFLHAISHGAQSIEAHTLRWATDATILLRHAGPRFDWERLVHETLAHRLAPPIYDGLVALQTHLGLEIPAAVIRALRRRSGPLSRLEHRLRAIPGERLGRIARLYLQVADYRRREPGLMARPLAAAVLPALRERFRARNGLALAALVLFAALGRPLRLRRWLRIDRWARTLDGERLPEIGTTVDSTGDGATTGAFVDGWSHPEPAGQWSRRTEARLAWRLPEDCQGDLVCEIDASPLRARGGPAPTVDFFANDRHVARWDTGPMGEYRAQPNFRIPAAALVRAPFLVVTIALDRLHAPFELGISQDPRPLGVFLRRIAPIPAADGPAVRYRPPPSRLAQYWRDHVGARNLATLVVVAAFAALGRPPALRRWLRIDRWARYVDAHRLPPIDVAFPPATPAEADPCLDGWALPEPGGRWTVAREARAAWRLPKGFEGELDCEVAAGTLAKPGLAPPAVAIWANDRQIAHWHSGPGGGQRIDRRLRIPAAALRGATTLVLAFAVNPLRSPAELGQSADTRTLGLFVERIRFSRPAA